MTDQRPTSGPINTFCENFKWPLTLQHVNRFPSCLDQELISYTYSSSFSCWVDFFKKGLRLHYFKSDRDEIL